MNNTKNNDLTASKFTPEMHSQALPCLAPQKKSKFSKMLLQKKKPVSTVATTKSNLNIQTSLADNKTPTAGYVSSSQQIIKASYNLQRLLQGDTTNPELSSTSNSMFLTDEASFSETTKSSKFKKLELKFSMDQEEDEASKSSEMLFMSMNSFVETSKLGTNDTISFLHQSNMNDSEFQLGQQCLKVAVNMARDEFMDASF